GDASARTWLLQIAGHTCADHVRRRTRRRALVERLAARSEAPVEADASGAVDLDAAVAALDEDRRAAFVLTQVVGLSYAEAAEVCQVPIGTIRSRVARARSDLLAAIGTSPEADPSDATG